MENSPPKSAKDLISVLGRSEVAKRLGIAEETVRVTLADSSRGGLLPSHWFFALSSMGQEGGVAVSTDLFRQKRADNQASA